MILFTLLSGACDLGDDGEDSTAPVVDLSWYTTCGDPSCSGYDEAAHKGVAACTSDKEGAPCSDEGATCDPKSDCNAEIVCATEDPKDQPGGCPISVREAKTDIRYLDPRAEVGLHDQIVAMRLAEYRYRAETEGRHVGFLIDDQPPGSPAVMARGDRVDLYGYTTMAVAAIQVQSERIAALEARLAELEGEQTRTCEP
jgi:hypothetical protein